VIVPDEELEDHRPGSATAISHGCLCPVLINQPGVGPGWLLAAPDCPLHRPPDPTPDPVPRSVSVLEAAASAVVSGAGRVSNPDGGLLTGE
jgi:hypothetical protein